MSAAVFDPVAEFTKRCAGIPDVCAAFGLTERHERTRYDADAIWDCYTYDRFFCHPITGFSTNFYFYHYPSRQLGSNLGVQLTLFAESQRCVQIVAQHGNGSKEMKAFLADFKCISVVHAAKYLANFDGAPAGADPFAEIINKHLDPREKFEAQWTLAVDVVKRLFGPIASGQMPWPDHELLKGNKQGS
jgi:hypothetical protein